MPSFSLFCSLPCDRPAERARSGPASLRSVLKELFYLVLGHLAAVVFQDLSSFCGVPSFEYVPGLLVVELEPQFGEPGGHGRYHARAERLPGGAEMGFEDPVPDLFALDVESALCGPPVLQGPPAGVGPREAGPAAWYPPGPDRALRRYSGPLSALERICLCPVPHHLPQRTVETASAGPPGRL